jgi:hypothetical protein
MIKSIGWNIIWIINHKFPIKTGIESTTKFQPIGSWISDLISLKAGA